MKLIKISVILILILISTLVAEGKEDHADQHNDHDKKTETHSADEDAGRIQLPEKAQANFEIKKIKILKNLSVEIPKEAVVKTGLEQNIYRYRNGFYKRIDFKTMQKKEKTLLISSKDLKANDEVVVHGIGFLRIAEIAILEGSPEGHSH